MKKYEFKTESDILHKGYPLQAVFSLIKEDVDHLIVEKSPDQLAHLDLVRNFSLPKMLLTEMASLQRFKQAAQILDVAKSYLIRRNDSSFDTIKIFAEKYCNGV